MGATWIALLLTSIMIAHSFRSVPIRPRNYRRCVGPVRFQKITSISVVRPMWARLYSSATDESLIRELSEKVAAQGNVVRELKANKADKDDIKVAVDALLTLKAELSQAESPQEPQEEKKPEDKKMTPKEQRIAAREAQKNSKGAGKKIDVSQTLEEIKKGRLDKMEAMRQAGVNPFQYNFNPTITASAVQDEYAGLEKGQEDPGGTEVSMSGRVLVRRVFGKLAFFTLQDNSGTVQLYLEEGRMGEEAFGRIKDWTDGGDLIGVHGTIKKTDKGELSVYVKEWEMLTKSLTPLPDKWSGLKDRDTRYRQRHLDMIVNPDVRRTFRSRSFIIAAIRRMLDTDGFLEIETPILESQPGGAEAKPFETYHNSLGMPLTLRIATELHLKRLIVGGFDRVYEIGRIFRNEGLSTRHNPEFTSIELYQAYADYDDMMRLTENMLATIAKDLTGSMVVPYQGEQIDLTPPWRRVPMHELVQEATGVDFLGLMVNGNIDGAKSAAVAAGVPADTVSNKGTVGDILNVCFEELCEDKLIQPTFVTEHPIEISPLAKPHRSKPGLTERFELFAVGREHANAFSELTDPIDQRKRFEAQAAKKAAGDEEACGVDEDFLGALETGMPPTAGLGIGIDRVVMLLTDSPAIRDVIAFPLLRKEAD